MKTIRTILLIVVIANIALLLNVAAHSGASIFDEFKQWELWVFLSIIAIPHISGIGLFFYTRKKHFSFSVVKTYVMNGLMIGIMLPVIYQLYFHIAHFRATFLWVLAISVIYYGIPAIILSCFVGAIIGLIIKHLKNH